MRFLRSQAYIDYFNYLDQAGGFYYERWGDAPVRMPPDLQPGAYSFSMVTIYGAACHDFPEWWERGGVGVDGCLLVLCSMHHVVRMNPAPLKVLDDIQTHSLIACRCTPLAQLCCWTHQKCTSSIRLATSITPSHICHSQRTPGTAASARQRGG